MIDSFMELEKPREVEGVALGSEAEKIFEQWKISKEDVRVLTHEILTQFDYANCLGKMERLAQNKILVNFDTKIATLPFVFDVMGRGDGQCGDLAKQLLTNGNFVAWLEDINTDRNNKIVPLFCSGNSKTHFSIPQDTKHFFVGLALESSNETPKIIVDPSFGIVKSLNESGYRSEKSKANKHAVSMQLHHVFEFGEYKHDAFLKETTITPKNGLVLGMSGDKKYAYSLYLTKDKDLNKMIPVMRVILENSIGKTYAWLNPSSGKIWSNDTKAYNELSIVAKKEIKDMLHVGEKFQYISNPNLAKSYISPENVRKEANVAF